MCNEFLESLLLFWNSAKAKAKSVIDVAASPIE